jgi:hypothetical protein
MGERPSERLVLMRSDIAVFRRWLLATSHEIGEAATKPVSKAI